MSISLREITEKNFNDCIKLKVAEDQKNFVATNLMSIAQSKVYPFGIPSAVYNDEELVGFTLYGQDPESKKYYIVRLMIDEKFQGKGFGKQATLKLIEKMGEYEDCDAVYLYFVDGNKGAEKLYSNIGFVRTGVTDEDGEIEMKLDLKKAETRT
ncbi:MAG: GNAT family N-acetyltransferase [Acidobacteriota bacterium]|jgi:diamine N-acetyltransferase|nr:GNAT family N-acetyltransferase [Acidobacteriota bacterium]